MKIFFRLFVLLMIFRGAFATNEPVVDKNLQAVQKLYVSNHQNLFLVRQILFEKKSYNLYLRFLDTLPLSLPHLRERVNTDLLIGSNKRIVRDLLLLLNENPDDFFLSQNSKRLLSPEVLKALSPAFTNVVLFQSLSTLALNYFSFDEMDSVIKRFALVSKEHRRISVDYVLKSERIKARYLGEWITNLQSKDPFLTAVQMRQRFEDGLYSEVLDQAEVVSNEKPNLRDPFGVDIFLLIARSALYMGYFERAWRELQKVHSSSMGDIAFEKIRTALVLGKNKLAKSFLPKIRNDLTRNYLETLICIEEGNTNVLILLDNVVQSPHIDISFLSETLILLKTARKHPQNLANLCDDLILFLNRQPFSNSITELDLLSRYRGIQTTFNGSGRLDEMNRYMDARQIQEEGKIDLAQKMWLVLIKDGKSPLVRELALSALRKSRKI